jgi:ADP-ribose pyrophosphatase YjhB (NUDIX family)
MIETKPRTQEYPAMQFATGEIRHTHRHLPDDLYAAALDTLVIVCVDFIPLHDGKMLLSRRTRQPHPSWWVNGGRMRKGEVYGEAASRLMRDELGLRVACERFKLLGHYSLQWDTRAQAPQGNGCHTLSITHAIELTADEVDRISPCDEYDGLTWVAPSAVPAAPDGTYHPALQAMVHDLFGLLRERL